MVLIVFLHRGSKSFDYLSFSMLTSLPEYLPNRIRSPAYTSLTGRGRAAPSNPLHSPSHIII